MTCPHCAQQNADDAERCEHCAASLVVATLDVVRGETSLRNFKLLPRSLTVGRARTNDVCLVEASVSKLHARLLWKDGGFEIEDQESTHGVYVDGVRVERATLVDQAQVQLGNITKYWERVAA